MFFIKARRNTDRHMATRKSSKCSCPTSKCSSEMVSSLRLGQLAARVKRAWNPSCHLPHPSCMSQYPNIGSLQLSLSRTFVNHATCASDMHSSMVLTIDTRDHIRYKIGGFKICSHTVCQSSMSCEALHLAGTMSTTSSSWHLSKTCTMDLSDTCITSIIRCSECFFLSLRLTLSEYHSLQTEVLQSSTSKMMSHSADAGCKRFWNKIHLQRLAQTDRRLMGHDGICTGNQYHLGVWGSQGGLRGVIRMWGVTQGS